MKSNHWTGFFRNCRKNMTKEGKLFSYGSECHLHCSNLSLSQGPSNSFPIPPCVPCHSFSSSTWTGGATLLCHLPVTDGLPCTLLTSLRLLRSEELHSWARPCWETKKVTGVLTSYQIKVKQKGAILFHLFWENEEVLKQEALLQREAQIQA